MLHLLIVLYLVASPALVASLEFTEDLRIETAGTDQEFGRIRDVVVDDDGTLYVFDTGFGVIRAFDGDGQHLRSFGQTGDGPGDIPERMLTVMENSSLRFRWILCPCRGRSSNCRMARLVWCTFR